MRVAHPLRALWQRILSVRNRFSSSPFPPGFLFIAFLCTNNAFAQPRLDADDEELILLGTPQVMLTEPLAESLFAAPANITLEAQAGARASGIRRVDFLQNGNFLGSSATQPYAFVWQNVPAGVYQLSAHATSGLSFIRASAPVRVRVCGIPAASLNATATEILLGQSVRLTAQAESPAGACRIGRIEVHAQGASSALLTTFSGLPPYQTDWTPTTAGDYLLRARAYDERDVVGTSPGIAITVKSPLPPPRIVLTAPLADVRYTAGSTISLAAIAEVPGGSVGRVAFFEGNIELAEGVPGSGAPAGTYAASWRGVPLGNHSVFARLTDHAGASHDSAGHAVKVCAPPTVQLTAPADGYAAVVPGELLLQAQAAAAADCSALTRVEFYQGSVKIGESIAAPYQYLWQNIPAGQYRLTARAVDDLGGVAASTPIAIEIMPPQAAADITLVSPGGGNYPAGSTVILAATTNLTPAGVQGVEFFAGAARIAAGTLSGGQYIATWPNVPAGEYSVFARLTDNTNRTYDSAAADIRVIACAPSVSLASPADGATAVAPGAFVLTAAASVNDGCGSIARVELYNGAALLHTMTAPPYTYNWQDIPAGSYVLSAKAIDSQGIEADSGGIHVSVASGSCALPQLRILNPLPGERKPALADFELAAEVFMDENCADIEEVEFYADDRLLHKAGERPYNFHWKEIPEGVYVLVARAVDSQGREILSEKVVVAVENPEEWPRIAFRRPVNDEQFNAWARISFEMEMDSPWSFPYSVEIFASGDIFSENGSFLTRMDHACILTIKESFDKPHIWNGVLPGNYTFIAKMITGNGESVLSDPVFVKVVYAPGATPSLIFKQPLPGFVYQEPADIPIKMQVTDGWVRRIDFYGDGDRFLGSAAEPPFSLTWAQVTQGDSPDGKHTITAKAEKASGETVVVESAPFYVRRETDGRTPPVKITSPKEGSVFFHNEMVPFPYSLYGGEKNPGGRYGVLSRQIAVEIEVDTGNISRVREVGFYGDGEFIGNAKLVGEWEGTQYYEILWQDVSEGSHSLLVRVHSDEGSFYSAPVLIDFKEPFHIKITSPKEGDHFDYPVIPFKVETYPKDVAVNEEGISAWYFTDISFCVPPHPPEVDMRGGAGFHAICVGARPQSPYSPGVRTGIWGHSFAGRACLSEDSTWHDRDQLSIDCITVSIEALPPEPEPALRVYSPTEGMVTSAPVIAVSGEVDDPEEALLQVNGERVPLSEDGRFSVENVRLSMGENTIVVTLFSHRRNESQTIRVTRIPEEEADDQELTFTLTPSEGVAPLTTVLQISSGPEAKELKHYCFNIQVKKGEDGYFTNVAALDEVSTKNQKRLTYQIQDAGYYVFRIELSKRIFFERDGLEFFLGCGQLEHTVFRSVIVESPERIARNAIEAYKNMVSHLSEGDDVGALGYFTGDARPRFSEVFKALKNDLPGISGKIGTLTHGVIGYDIVELMIVTETAQRKELFPVYLIRGSDGIWRIDDM